MKSMVSFLVFVSACCFVQAQTKLKFYKADSLKLTTCNCDSIYKQWKPKPAANADVPEFDGNGWNKLYNFQNKIGQCGYFNKFYFMYGLHFKYDSDGNLIKINKFYNGKLIGVCEFKKK